MFPVVRVITRVEGREGLPDSTQISRSHDVTFLWFLTNIRLQTSSERFGAEGAPLATSLPEIRLHLSSPGRESRWRALTPYEHPTRPTAVAIKKHETRFIRVSRAIAQYHWSLPSDSAVSVGRRSRPPTLNLTSSVERRIDSDRECYHHVHSRRQPRNRLSNRLSSRGSNPRWVKRCPQSRTTIGSQLQTSQTGHALQFYSLTRWWAQGLAPYEVFRKATNQT